MASVVTILLRPEGSVPKQTATTDAGQKNDRRDTGRDGPRDPWGGLRYPLHSRPASSGPILQIAHLCRPPAGFAESRIGSETGRVARRARSPCRRNVREPSRCLSVSVSQGCWGLPTDPCSRTLAPDSAYRLRRSKALATDPASPESSFAAKLPNR